MSDVHRYFAAWTLASSVTPNGVARVAEGFSRAVYELGLPTTQAAMGLRTTRPEEVNLPSRPFAMRVLNRERALRAAVRDWSCRAGAGTMHCHDPLQAAAVWQALAKTSHRRVYTVHSPVAHEASARRGAIRQMSSRRLLLEAEHRAVNGADVVHCLSEHVASLIRDAYPGVEPAVVRFGLPDVQQRAHHPDGFRRPAGSYALCVRRLEPRTGVDLVLQTWGTWSGLPPLVVVGTGSMDDELRRLAVGSASPVEFRGRVSDGDLRRLYAEARVNVMPTRAMEGFGLPILEAAADGVPTVGFDVGAVREVVEGTGQPEAFVVPPQDLEALQAAVSMAVRWPDQARRALRERVRTTWSMQARLPELCDLLGLPSL